MNADRNLLAGILALQNAFIDRHQLVAAFDRWIVDKSLSMLGILEAQGHVSAECRALLEALVEQHLKRHGDDPEKSLAALSSIGSARAPLAALADQDLDASLARVSAAHVSAAHVSAGGDAPGGIGDLFRQAGVRPAEGEADGRFRPVPGCESTVEGGRFTILRAHAKGGLGQVSVALDGELNREVAFKEIQERYADDPASRKRFLLEAEITGGREHPGIVPVYGLGAYGDGRPYYAMRFIKGDNLNDAIKRFHREKKASGGRQPPVSSVGEQQASGGTGHPRSGSAPVSSVSTADYASLAFRKLLGRFVDVCNAVEYAHSRGVLHRDLKPGNIMLGKYGETLVVDWGLAKVVGRAEGVAAGEATLRPLSRSEVVPTQIGSIVGTPQFMSPEQAEGRLDELGPATDVYSLGATLYTILTGVVPFAGAPTHEVLLKVVKGEFAPPRRLNRRVPRALEAICVKAMAIKAADRYPSPRAVADEIEHWLAGRGALGPRSGNGDPADAGRCQPHRHRVPESPGAKPQQHGRAAERHRQAGRGARGLRIGAGD